MTSVLTTGNVKSTSPTWEVTETEASANSPGDNGTDFVVNAFSSQYLKTGTTVDGWLFTETAAARISDIGGAKTFDRKYTYPAVTLCRQAQSSWGANGWVMSVSYDDTNGTLCHYSTDGWATVNQSVVSSAVHATAGETYMPGLWMDQRVPGRAICTALKAVASGFTGSDATPTGSNTWRRRFIINSTNGAMGWTLSPGTLSANGVDMVLSASPNATLYVTGSITVPAGSVVTAMYFLNCSNPFPIANVYRLYYPSGNYTVTPLPSNCGGPSTKAGLSEGTGTYGFYAYDQRPHVSGTSATYAYDFNLEGTGPNPFTSLTTAAAFVTDDYGATWTEITDNSVVGYIQPGDLPSGAIEAPYTPGGEQKVVYGYLDTAGTYPAPRLKRVVGTTVTDISPTADGKTYGVPYNRPSRRAIAISIANSKTAFLCGESRNASTGVSTYRVFWTPDIFAAAPEWAALTAESATPVWRGAYPAGDTWKAAWFLGTNGNPGLWYYDTSAASIFDKAGDSPKTGVDIVGLCGI